MTNQHPITPHLELVKQWMRPSSKSPLGFDTRMFATQAARWGWDQRNATVPTELQQARDEELGACCEWVEREIGHGREWGTELRTARRPEPPSLSSIALQMLNTIERDAHYLPEITDTIRRALEALSE
jgi:hypothetical protein